jgi:hypothetical protein
MVGSGTGISVTNSGTLTGTLGAYMKSGALLDNLGTIYGSYQGGRCHCKCHHRQ